MNARLHAGIVIILALLLVIPAIPVEAVPQSSISTLQFGGDGNDYTWNVHPSPDGDGFVYIVTTQSFGVTPSAQYDGALWYVRFDREGHLLYSVLHQPASGDTGYFYDSALLPDGSVLVAGSRSDWREAWLIRLAPDGSLVYWKSIDLGVSTYYFYAMSIAVGPDGHAVLSASYYSGGFRQLYVKFDPETLAVDWAVGIAVSGSYANPFDLAVWNNTVFAALYNYYGSFAGAVALNYTTGDIVWYKRFQFSTAGFMYSVAAGDGMLYLVGATGDLGSAKDPYVLAVNASTGEPLWGRAILSEGEDWLIGVEYSSGFGVLASGFLNPGTGSNRSLVLAFNSTGEQILAKSIGAEGYTLYAYTVHVDRENRLYLLGNSNFTGNDDGLLLTLVNGSLVQCNLPVEELEAQWYNVTATDVTVTVTTVSPAFVDVGVTSSVIPEDLITVSGKCGDPTVGGIVLHSDENSPGATAMALLVGSLLVLAVFSAFGARARNLYR